MPAAGATYEPRAPEDGVLHAVIREHLETFLAEAARGTDGPGLPAFVEQEFRDYLTCGVLAHGFARVRCDTCAFERLVPFSCKGLRVLSQLRWAADDGTSGASGDGSVAARPSAGGG
jgi:hypothetical protein